MPALKPVQRALTSWPSKLPPTYVAKTLARFLPGEEELKRLSKDELIALARKREELEALILHEPLRFFIPNIGAQRDFLECDTRKSRVRLYISGNKGGKTTAGAIKTLEYCLATPLWGDKKARAFSFRKPPIRWCVFAEDFDSHKEVTVPTIATWAPPGTIQREIKNPQGQVTQHTLTNGSIIHYRTYDQGFDKAEGKDWDGAWLDEPPPRDLYTSVFRGLVARDGIMLITATLLKETWLYDELEQPHVRGFEGSIHDNSHLSEQAKEDFLASLDEDERAVREHGRPRNLVGLIYKNFHDGYPYIIENKPVPEGYPIIMGVDPHERKPLYVLYGYIEPDDRIVWFRYELVPTGKESEIFSKLSQIHTEMGITLPNICIMDPNRGKARQIGGDCWQDMFERHGYPVVLGEDDIRIGHTLVRAYLDYKNDEVPAMQFMESCRGTKGPIYQLKRYAWADWQNNRRGEKDLKEAPREANKDFPDIIRYTAAANLTFDALCYGYDTVDLAPKGWREERRIRAYA